MAEHSQMNLTPAITGTAEHSQMNLTPAITGTAEHKQMNLTPTITARVWTRLSGYLVSPEGCCHAARAMDLPRRTALTHALTVTHVLRPAAALTCAVLTEPISSQPVPLHYTATARSLRLPSLCPLCSIVVWVFMEKVYRSSKWWEVKDWGESVSELMIKKKTVTRNCTQYCLTWVFLPFVHVVF